MAIVKPKVDAVIVGMGWTGAIMAKELTDAGLRVVALERGPDRDTQPDFAYPRVVDELEGSIHRKFLQSLSKETITARHTAKDYAVPYRQVGSFKPGTGVGGRGHALVGLPLSGFAGRFQFSQQPEAALRRQIHPRGHDRRGFSGVLRGLGTALRSL
jgi:gluconate 2-dehydrogenase alpha chain